MGERGLELAHPRDYSDYLVSVNQTQTGADARREISDASMFVDVHLLSGNRVSLEVEADASAESLKQSAQSALLTGRRGLLNSLNRTPTTHKQARNTIEAPESSLIFTYTSAKPITNQTCGLPQCTAATGCVGRLQEIARDEEPGEPKNQDPPSFSRSILDAVQLTDYIEG